MTKRFWITYLAVVTILAAILVIGVVAVKSAGPEYGCMEDMPCWDCETMGNRICGTPAE